MEEKKEKFALCIDNTGYTESLEKRKFYQVIEDTEAAKENMIRVVDESGEDYLYAKEMFLDLSLPPQIEEALKVA